MKPILLVLVMNLCFLSTQAQTTPNYTLSIVPQFPRLVIFEDWQPLVDHLSTELGITLELAVQDSIPEFERSFLAGEPDFAFMNPYHAVMAMKAEAYRPLVSDASRQLKGILVTRKDSAINSIHDLEGQDIAFPSPNAFGASLYMRALLDAQEGINFNARYVETHSNAYRHTLMGQTSAGGGVWNTFNKESADLRAELNVVYETPGVIPHPLSAHPRVPIALQEQMIQVILTLFETEEGRTLLNAIQLREPIRVDYEANYKALEELNLENYISKQEDSR